MQHVAKKLALGVALVGALAACKQKETAKSSPPPVTNTNTTPTQSGVSPALTIEVVGQTGTEFNFNRNDIVQLRFRIGGLTAQSNIVTGLSEMPAGGQLTAGNTAEPIFTWTAASEGTVYVSVVVRDLDACAQAGAVDCAITEQQLGTVVANPIYDVTQRYSIIVGPRTGVGSVGNSISDAGATNGAGGFLSNVLGGAGNIFSGVGSFLGNMTGSIWEFFKGLFT